MIALVDLAANLEEKDTHLFSENLASAGRLALAQHGITYSSSRRRAGGLFPPGMSLEFEAAANGQSKPFMAIDCLWRVHAISKAFLGGILTFRG